MTSPATTYPSEYPEAPTHPHRYTPPNVLRLDSGVYHPTLSNPGGASPPYPMPSFLLKKYQASRDSSGARTPGSQSSTNLPTQTANTSFNSGSFNEVAADVAVVPKAEPVQSFEAPSQQHYTQDWYDDEDYPHYESYPRYEDRRPSGHRQYRQPATRQSWYYPQQAPAPAPTSQADAISEWQQQLQMKQQRAPRTADFGFGATPEEERNRALAQNRQLPPAELKRLKKFYDNRNEHSHPTSRT